MGCSGSRSVIGPHPKKHAHPPIGTLPDNECPAGCVTQNGVFWRVALVGLLSAGFAVRDGLGDLRSPWVGLARGAGPPSPGRRTAARPPYDRRAPRVRRIGTSMAWPHPSRIGGGIMMSWISIATSAGMSDAWVGGTPPPNACRHPERGCGGTSRLAVDYLIALPVVIQHGVNL